MFIIYLSKEKEMDNNVDYKELYLKMVRANEAAIRILIAAQQECEELYLAMGEKETEIKIIPLSTGG